jgi:hypothetical protein
LVRIRNSNDNNKITNDIIFKWGKELNKHFSKEKHKWPSTPDKMPLTVVIKEIKISSSEFHND